MRAIVQRVSKARVTVAGELTGQIERGLLVYVGVGQDDVDADAEFIAGKIRFLRVFEDRDGKMNIDVADIGGAVLLVSNFSLYADCRKGRRPAFVDAAPPAKANELYERVCEKVRSLGVRVETGRFQQTMAVEAVNDGPINIWLDSRA
ncbi:MAG: D-tyrosyl-tRNA(Tyr) deacylase [Phycisphaerae bacterium]|nr:D-tyrosyl-tRNA(Tyr) deacylase [Phycisphaerae bacterium]